MERLSETQGASPHVTIDSHAAQGAGYALLAIVLWSSTAYLGVALAHVPPLFLIGIGLIRGGIYATPSIIPFQDGLAISYHGVSYKHDEATPDQIRDQGALSRDFRTTIGWTGWLT